MQEATRCIDKQLDRSLEMGKNVQAGSAGCGWLRDVARQRCPKE